MRASSALLCSAIVLALAACGGDGDSGSPTGADDGGSFRATIDGQAWSAAQTGAIRGEHVLSLAGATFPTQITISLVGVTAPGTYQLSGDSTSQAKASVLIGDRAWITAAAGGSGTVTITTLTPSRAAGTFSFDAVPFVPPATGTKRVTAGQFDISF
jgi:hypothetical protein